MEIFEMEKERDHYVKVCPYCGGSEIILAYQIKTSCAVARFITLFAAAAEV